MMHTTCLNSLRCTHSPLFNDPTYFFDARFHTNPLLISSSFDCCYCCCCCCCCCANNNYTNNIFYNRLPRTNPSFLCNGGSRQSTLIQFSPSKRLIFHGRRRQSCNYTSGFSSLTDSDRNYYYQKLFSFKEMRKLRKGRYACWGFDDNRKEQFSSNGFDDDCVDDVEILLDLLTEDVGLENMDVRESIRVEKKDRAQGFTNKTVSVGSAAVKRDLKSDHKAVKVQSKEDEDRKVRHGRREERGTFVKEVNRERRKEGSSSCSSYYSISSKDEFESDNDVEIEHDGGYVRGESSSKYKEDGKKDSLMKSYNEEFGENIDRRQEVRKEKGECLKNNTAEIYYGNQEWRKKSEKKLNVESSQHQSQASVNSERNSQQDNIITDQSLSRMKHKRLTEASETDNRVIDSSSSTQKSYSDTKNKLNTSLQELTRKHRGETTDHDTHQDEYRRQSNVISEVSGIHEVDMRVASSSSLLEARKKNSEDISTKVSRLVEDRREEHHRKIDHLTTSKESRLKSQEILDTRITNTENTSVTRRQSDTRSEKEELRLETSSSAEKVTMAQQVALRRKNVEDKYSSSEVELMGGTTSSMKTGRRTTKASSFNVGMPKETSSPYKALKLNPEPNLQESGSHGAGTSSSLAIDTASSSQRVSGGKLYVELAHEHSSERFEAATSELQEQTQQTYGMQRSGILGGVIDSDPIDSADQQVKSSSQFVGEFVKKAKHELSTSEVQQEKITNETELVYDDAEQQHELKSSDSGNSDKKDGASGPSDEMWHVTNSSAQQPSETDAPDNTSTRNDESGKKSGRSLWNVIGDVVRLRWASPRSEATTPKSGGGKASASSNQSMSSEAWFSGHEHEDLNVENVKMGSTKGRSQSTKETSNSSSSKEKVRHEGLDTLLSSSNTNQTSSMSPSVVEESSFPLPAFRMRRSPVVKRTSWTGETDAPSGGELVRMDQPVPKPTTQVPHMDVSGSGAMVKSEQPVPVLLTEISPADASGSGKMVNVDELVPAPEAETRSKDGELKRRKLARIDQVSKDRFDEWEEAYTLEAKQRKSDELFMREALLEAQKAADFWEVPVGAVLVQDGKVIARGYNLVEELRDSTAHAEMICIREASNNLRSWRLSGTTLYVTLEPCPMCAGAILQARIDTVVWGAPNKLLGADGSWIRLFPEGEGGNGSSDKPPAPVHPFHPNMKVRRGVLSSECADVMQQFFQLRRKKKEKRREVEAPSPPPTSCLPITHHHHHSKLFSKMHDAFNIMFCL